MSPQPIIEIDLYGSSYTYIEIDYVPYVEGDIQVYDGYGLVNEEEQRYNLYIIYKIDLKKCNISKNNEAMIKNCFNI